eukprot:CAMPEP_0197023208 /NCGR_PEP_ID=MMETSP1384-20130603/3981_1 /TAXON_ID=29189 /ORGANISM="Ammonia sp." /LENGTH=489 /DNA_ID=CAMNT_0042451399 /DNA_START=160 /DNA_END=1629 /DNA_ORIENTATION=+
MHQSSSTTPCSIASQPANSNADALNINQTDHDHDHDQTNMNTHMNIVTPSNLDTANVVDANTVKSANSSEVSGAFSNNMQTVDERAKCASNNVQTMHTMHMHATHSEASSALQPIHEHVAEVDHDEPADSVSPNDSPNDGHLHEDDKKEEASPHDMGLLQQQIENLEEEQKRKLLTDKLYEIIEPLQPLLVAKITGMIIHHQPTEKILDYLLDPERKALLKQIDQASELLTGSMVTGGEYYTLYHDLSRCNNSNEKLTYLRSKLYPKVEQYVFRKTLAEQITEMLLDKLDTPQLIVILDPDEEIALKSRMDQAIAAYIMYHQQLARQQEMQRQQKIQQQMQLQQQQQQQQQQQKLQHHQRQLTQLQLQRVQMQMNHQQMMMQKMNQQRMQQHVHRQISAVHQNGVHPHILQQQRHQQFLRQQQQQQQQQQQRGVNGNGMYHPGGTHHFQNANGMQMKYQMHAHHAQQQPQSPYNVHAYQNALRHQQRQV